jgi:hypothetical protein
MKYYLLLPLFLIGCGSNPPSAIDLAAPKTRPISIDARLLEECGKFSDLKNNPKPSEVIEQHGKDAQVLATCAEGKKKLINAILPFLKD